MAANDAGEDFKDISINIINVVESPPSWGVQYQEVDYIENDSVSVPYLFDVDGGDGAFNLSLLGDDYHQFSITQDGVINFLSSPDFETQDLYSIKVVATNDAGTGIKDLSINIIDIPDIAPVWDIASEVVSYTENDTTSLVYDTGVNPGDRPITSYIVSGDHSGDFLIDSSNGVINFLSSPDFETQDLYSIKVVATNDAGTGIKDLSINIIDIPDIAPVWDIASEVVSYTENDTTSLVYDTGINPGDRPITSYIVSGDHSGDFLIDSSNGVINFLSSPDFETQDLYSIKVVATNDAGTGIKDLSINIIDIPDIAPVWDIASEVVSYTENDTTSLVYDTGINPGDRPITSYIVSGDHSGDFLIDSSNGVINFLSSPDFETQDLYSIKVVATNDAGNWD